MNIELQNKSKFFKLRFQDRIFSKSHFKSVFRKFFKKSLTNEIAEYNKKLIKSDQPKYNLDYISMKLSRAHEIVIFTAVRKLTMDLQRPPRFLEVGTYSGTTLHAARLANLNSEIITLDLDIPLLFEGQPYQDRLQVAKLRDKNVKHTNSKLIIEDSLNIDWEKLGKFDLILIDGDHKIPRVDLDIYNALGSLNKNGLMIVDDIQRLSLFHFFIKNIDTSLRLKSLEEYQTLYNLETHFFPKTFGIRHFLDPICFTVSTKI